MVQELDREGSFTSPHPEWGFQIRQPEIGLRDRRRSGILDLMVENHSVYVFVPNNLTNEFQPLDLTVNGPSKSLPFRQVSKIGTHNKSRRKSKQVVMYIPLM